MHAPQQGGAPPAHTYSGVCLSCSCRRAARACQSPGRLPSDAYDDVTYAYDDVTYVYDDVTYVHANDPVACRV